MEPCLEQSLHGTKLKTLAILCWLFLFSLNASANHGADHAEYNHASTAASPIVPILSGLQTARAKAVETLNIGASQSFIGAAQACLGCKSEFLAIKAPQYDYTIFSPLRDLFLHQNANERFKNKFVRYPFAKSQFYFFEYYENIEQFYLSSALPDSLLALSQSPNLFYTTYGDQYVFSRNLGGFVFLAYRIDFPSEQERQFFESNVTLPKQILRNLQTLFTPEVADTLEKTNLDGVVTIAFFMVGGNQAYLEAYFNSKYDTPTARAMTCKFAALTDCLSAYARWQDYMFSENGLSASSTDYAADPAVTTQVIGYGLRNYSALGLNVSPPTDPSLTIAYDKQVLFNTNSKRLAGFYNKAQQQYERVSVLLSNYKARMTDEESQRLSNSMSQLKASIDSIANVGLACVDLQDSCLSDSETIQPYVMADADLQITPLTQDEMWQRLKPSSAAVADSGGGSFAPWLLLLLLGLFAALRLNPGARRRRRFCRATTYCGTTFK